MNIPASFRPCEGLPYGFARLGFWRQSAVDLIPRILNRQKWLDDPRDNCFQVQAVSKSGDPHRPGRKLREMFHVIATSLVPIDEWEKRRNDTAKVIICDNDTGGLSWQDAECCGKCGGGAGVVPTLCGDASAQKPAEPTKLGFTLGNSNYLAVGSIYY